MRETLFFIFDFLINQIELYDFEVLRFSRNLSLSKIVCITNMPI